MKGWSLADFCKDVLAAWGFSLYKARTYVFARFLLAAYRLIIRC